MFVFTKYLILFVVLQSSYLVLSQVKYIVTEFHGLDGRISESKFIKKYQNNQDISIKGYVISLKIKRAEYAVLPWRKLSYFNMGKSELEQLIKKEPDNIHLRYLRLIIQEKSPKILGYHKNTKEDKNKLISFMNKNNSNYLVKLIKKNTSL